jgi:gliding motility-associated-like protein
MNRILLVVLFLCGTLSLSAQDMTVSGTLYTPEELVKEVLINNSPCAQISNVSFKRASQYAACVGQGVESLGYFENTHPDFSMENGIILSTGNIANAPGPKAFGTQGVGCGGFPYVWSGDSDLFNYIQGLGIDPGLSSYNNATVLEFDFVPTTNHISFNFIFASDEYGGWQCQFADAFAFFLTNTETNATTNLAIVPGTTDPISVLTIRDNAHNGTCQSVNPEYFGAYYPGGTATAPINFLGRTVKMTAESDVTAHTTYHIKLVIADRNDESFDSAVFIEGGSFDIGAPSLGDDLIIEGSNALCPGDTFLIDSKLDPELYTFQWTRDGVDIVGANGPSYLVAESGLYGLKLGNKGTGDCVINPEPIKIEYFDSIILERELEDLIKCTGEGQGLIFNLQEAVEGLTFSPVVYEFYNSFTDAEAQTGALGDFYHMSSNASTKTVWVRIQSIDGNPCYKIMSFTLRKEICEVEIVHLNDLEVCANGAASFDLTVYNDIVYHGLPGYNVSYHTSEADAIGAANAIPAGDLTAYPGTHNEVIWVRVTKADDPTVYQYTSFKLLIRPVPVINPNLTALYACVEEGAGTGDFNLGSKDNEIKQSASGLIVEYYASEAAAEEGDPANKLSSSSYISGAGTVYIRLYSPLTGCYSVGELELKLGNIPSLSGESEVQVCDNSGYYNFNLTVIAADVIGVGTLADVTYKFYTTYSDAQNKLNSLSGGYYTNTQPWSEVIYLRVEDKVSKCYVIQAIGLKVGEKPALGTASDLEACDSGTTGVANFDLTQRETEILNGLDAASYHIYYYSSMAQAQAGGTSGRINTPASYSNLTTNYVYVRVENKATGCYSIAQIKLVVHPRPVVSSNISDLKMCDGVENDGIAEFVLKTKALSIAAGNNDLVVSFHETQPDAENNANGLNQEGYLNITPHQQTIYIRVTDSTTGCYVIRTMKLIVNTYPVFTLDEEVVVCSSSNSSIGEFNLVAIGQSYTENYLNYNFRFYETYANAVGNIDHIIDPESYHNVAEGVTSVWVRIENIETGCIGIYAIALRVNKSPVVPANVPVLSVCDTYGNPHDGKAEVDLTLNSSIISQNMGSVPYQIIYYKNQANAENNQQAINEPDAYYNDLSTETIWFRLVNLETGCYTIGHFDLEIKEGVVLVRPADITVCSDLSLGTNKYLFDLTIRENEALGGEPIFGVTVSYYESEADAQSGSNAIEDPTAYINTSAVQTIWIVAYRNNGCSTMTTMNLRVYATPSPNYSPSALEVCETEFGLGEAEFNLEDSIGDIISGDTHLEVSFYETAADAQSGDNEISAADRVEYVSESTLVYVRVENSLTGTDPKCFVIVELPLQVNAKPYIEVSPFIICMDNHPEYYKFNLEDKNEEILDGRSSEDYQVTYYTSEAAANDADQPVAYTYVNADPESQLLWIRLENLHTGCFHVAELLLQIEEKVYAFAPDAVEAEHFSVCADLESGLGNFNFSVFTPAIIGEQNLTAGDLKVTYYASESDYQAGEAIAAPTSVNLPVGEHAIVAVVSRRQTGFYCQDEVRFTVRVYETPVAPVLTGATVCTNYDNNTLYEPYVIDTHYDASQYDFVWMHNGDIVGGNQAYYVVDTPAKLGSYQVEVRYKGEDCPNLSNEVTIKTIRAFDIRVRNQDSTGMVGSIENEERVDVVIESPVDVYEEDEDGNVIVDDQFEYAINEGEYQDSRTFYNVPNGEHTLWVRYKGERSICPQSKSIFILGYPKYFTPNGDGFNDVWNVPGLKGHPEAVIYIFDRYGKLLQQLSPSGEGWDGTFKGKAMPSTDYWFMVEYLQESVDGKTPPRKVEFKGHFSLKR